MFPHRLSRTLWVSKHVGGRRLLSNLSLPIPSKPKGWPTPWITEADATQYLFPLYLQGWYVAAVATERRGLRAAGLARRFAFPGCDPATTFLKDILTLTETEKHHPQLLRLTNSPKSSVVHICTTTHSALRPVWQTSDTPQSRAFEGITLRDIRFAALTSSLPSSPGSPSAEIGPSSSRPSWEDLHTTLRLWATPSSDREARGPVAANGASAPMLADSKRKSAACPACNGPHSIGACPVRNNIPPPPCSICNELHWRVDCPLRMQAQLQNRTVTQIKGRHNRNVSEGRMSSVPPPRPCPNCGGAHWKVDCRVPQAPPGFLDRLKLPVPGSEAATDKNSQKPLS
ncbi:hypothetical protein GGX14DRAFT_432741 [Mycena pura]|uniref:4a-hydroxytetrahydrobiopterin dehydratase n=1 Tax=Mycena pura TaxID=153505 RepID=A0AAD6VQH4_9AGAR|nr:hypothetical protein GGX14DRAFT_432741 [Mycena pura]